MGLETGTTISSLIASNPTSADPVSQGDNHLQLIKSVLKAQFPGTAGSGYATAITATEAELNSLHTGSISTILPTISGYVIGANTAIASTDTLLAAIGKAQGQINSKTVITGSELVTNLQDVNGLNVTSGVIESAGRFTLSAVYTIQTIGTTTNAQWNTIAGTTNVAATALVAGRTYVIVSPGVGTDFTLIGAANNTIGTSFIATGAGTGTGTALRTYTVNSLFTCANIGTSMGDGKAFRETNTTAQRETATTFDIGGIYTIQSIGTTNFTLIGAASNTVGLVFTATGAGTGTGTALRKMSMGLSGSVVLPVASTIVAPTLTTPTINSASVPTISGTAPLYMCRAWVNFNGTGTVAIRASGNVSSITDNGTGDYTVNFTTAMPDANYSVALCGTSTNTVGNHDNAVQIAGAAATGATTKTVSALRLNTGAITAASAIDQFEVNASVFR